MENMHTDGVQGLKTLPLLLVGAMLMFVYPDIQLNLKSTLPKN